MQKIGIYTDPSRSLLIIETPSALQFELRDSSDKLLITGNKLRQASLSINIKNLAKGSYTLKINIDGGQVYKTIEL
jgi:hypothetical protein